MIVRSSSFTWKDSNRVEVHTYIPGTSSPADPPTSSEVTVWSPYCSTISHGPVAESELLVRKAANFIDEALQVLRCCFMNIGRELKVYE